MTARILFWDIESAGLNSFKADLAKIICFGYKFSDEKETHCITANQFRGWFSKAEGINDKPLLKKALEIMEEADLLVAHFGDKFDKRFFQGRCAINDLKPPPPTKQRDTWRIARGAFCFNSNRLGNLALALDVGEKKQLKTRRQWPGWWDRSLAGDGSAITEMAEYCKQDVRTLEAVYNRIRVYDNQQHPHMYHYQRVTCGICGGQVTYRGVAYIGRHKYPRYQCKACGRWGRETKKADD